MAEECRQLTLKERKEIEEGLTRGDSFRKIAELTGRSPSTVSREVRENRHVRAFKPRESLGDKSPIQMLRFVYGDEERTRCSTPSASGRWGATSLRTSPRSSTSSAPGGASRR